MDKEKVIVLVVSQDTLGRNYNYLNIVTKPTFNMRFADYNEYDYKQQFEAGLWMNFKKPKTQKH